MKPKLRVLNSDGKQIVLNAREQIIANRNQKILNELGYEIDVTTLTTIQKKVSEQKFFTIAPADYIPVKVGDGAWSTNLVTFRSFTLGDDFATGVIQTGTNNGRLASTDSAVDSVTVPVKNWAKSIGWTIAELEFAQKNNNWDLIAEKEKSRKKNWDLGIQAVAFLGLKGTNDVKGLYNLTGLTTNTTRITKKISAMTPAELKVLVANLISDYRINCLRTAMPTTFVVPESDYLGLSSQASADFPMKNVLDLLTEAFVAVTRNKAFQILPNAYGDADVNGSGSQTYVLLNKEEESIRMDITVDYTATVANTVDGYSYQNVGYGQFTGVGIYRPAEIMYFKYTV